MKRIAIACALLIVAVFTTVWSGFTFRRELNALSAYASDLAESLERCSEDEIREKTGLLLRRWERSSKILRFVFSHENIDALEVDINALPLILKYGGKTEFRLRCAEARSRIQGLLEAEELKAYNIF